MTGVDTVLTVTLPPRTLLDIDEAVMLAILFETAVPAKAEAEMTLTSTLVDDDWRRRPTKKDGSSRRRPDVTIVTSTSVTSELRA